MYTSAGSAESTAWRICAAERTSIRSTPAGVGRIEPGDKVTGGVAGLADIAFTMGQRQG